MIINSPWEAPLILNPSYVRVGYKWEWINELETKTKWYEGWRFVPYTYFPEYFQKLGTVNIGNTIRNGRFALMEMKKTELKELKNLTADQKQKLEKEGEKTNA